MMTTNPGMYDYFPVNDSILHLYMIGATAFMVAKTPQSLKIIGDVAECALIKGCMAPPNSKLLCFAENFQKREYANCHRYDQSALALSLAQCSLNIKDYQRLSDRIYVKRFWFNHTKDWAEIKKMFPWVQESHFH